MLVQVIQGVLEHLVWEGGAWGISKVTSVLYFSFSLIRASISFSLSLERWSSWVIPFFLVQQQLFLVWALEIHVVHFLWHRGVVQPCCRLEVCSHRLFPGEVALGSSRKTSLQPPTPACPRGWGQQPVPAPPWHGQRGRCWHCRAQQHHFCGLGSKFALCLSRVSH